MAGNLGDMRSLECLEGQKFLPPAADRAPQVEIVVPVLDEERDLGLTPCLHWVTANVRY